MQRAFSGAGEEEKTTHLDEIADIQEFDGTIGFFADINTKLD